MTMSHVVITNLDLGRPDPGKLGSKSPDRANSHPLLVKALASTTEQPGTPFFCLRPGSSAVQVSSTASGLQAWSKTGPTLVGQRLCTGFAAGLHRLWSV